MTTRTRTRQPAPAVRRRAAAGAVVALGLATGLAACGDDAAEDTATDPAPSSDVGSSSTPSPSEPEPTEDPTSGSSDPNIQTVEATGSAGVAEATVVAATEGGGSVSTLAFALDTEQAVADFAVELRSGLGESVSAAVADLAAESPDATPYGAVAHIGCEAPTSVAIEAGEAGFEVVPALPKSTVQCLAPVTYVVLFAAPNA
ncbi:hypothetical protein CFI00_19445 [Nocardioides sp. S5]|uniref:hypothetical protein n=1 Tax=Nocardioides sp. S5 TaxID=2017486 RepID=UPI001A8F96D4|nr:hypothetical protein [Nocardioides sp. S5]QSR32628.1 hypothetical protein CFI00_19445 [Nocardioides sp. S5]